MDPSPEKQPEKLLNAYHIESFWDEKRALNSWNEKDVVCILPTVFWLPILEGH